MPPESRPNLASSPWAQIPAFRSLLKKQEDDYE